MISTHDYGDFVLIHGFHREVTCESSFVDAAKETDRMLNILLDAIPEGRKCLWIVNPYQVGYETLSAGELLGVHRNPNTDNECEIYTGVGRGLDVNVMDRVLNECPIFWVDAMYCKREYPGWPNNSPQVVPYGEDRLLDYCGSEICNRDHDPKRKAHGPNEYLVYCVKNREVSFTDAQKGKVRICVG